AGAPGGTAGLAGAGDRSRRLRGRTGGQGDLRQHRRCGLLQAIAQAGALSGGYLSAGATAPAGAEDRGHSWWWLVHRERLGALLLLSPGRTDRSFRFTDLD